jgi:predicted transcriptional regulator
MQKRRDDPAENVENWLLGCVLRCATAFLPEMLEKSEQAEPLTILELYFENAALLTLKVMTRSQTPHQLVT